MSAEQDIAEIRDLMRDLPASIGRVMRTGNKPEQQVKQPHGLPPGVSSVAGSPLNQLLTRALTPLIEGMLGIKHPVPQKPIMATPAPPPAPPPSAMNMNLLKGPITPAMNMSLLSPQPPGPAMNMNLLASVNQPSAPSTATQVASSPMPLTPLAPGNDSKFADTIRDFAEVVEDFKEVVDLLKRRAGENVGATPGAPERTGERQVTYPAVRSNAFPSARTGVQVPTMAQVRR